jgi:hypothetical protein
MADENKGGFLGRAFGALMDEISEPPPGSAPVKKSRAKTPPIPALDEAPAAPANYVPPPVSAPMSMTPAAAAYAQTPFSAAMTVAAAPPVDEKTLGLINESVFTAETKYVQFDNVWNALNRTGDVGQVVTVLKMTVKDATPDNIIADIDVHLKALAATQKTANEELEGAAKSMLGGADQLVADLVAQNAAAQAEIERHQREMGERNTLMNQTQQKRIADEQNIASAKARTEAAIQFVSARLSTAKAALSALPK